MNLFFVLHFKIFQNLQFLVFYMDTKFSKYLTINNYALFFSSYFHLIIYQKTYLHLINQTCLF